MKKPKIQVFSYDLPEKLIHNIKEMSIDTEALGLNIQRDRLCAVQILANRTDIYIVHFPTGKYDSPNLQKLLSNDSIPKLFHYARFDVHIIYKYLKVLMKNIICTRSLSKITRTYSDKHGLKHLCKELLDISMNKGEQSSNWGADTLSTSQIEYAAGDVIYLHQIFEILKKSAEKENKYAIAERFFKMISEITFIEEGGFDVPSLIEHH